MLGCLSTEASGLTWLLLLPLAGLRAAGYLLGQRAAAVACFSPELARGESGAWMQDALACFPRFRRLNFVRGVLVQWGSMRKGSGTTAWALLLAVLVAVIAWWLSPVFR